MPKPDDRLYDPGERQVVIVGDEWWRHEPHRPWRLFARHQWLCLLCGETSGDPSELCEPIARWH